MMFADMSSRDRRAVTWGAVVLVPALLFVFGIKPWLASLDDMRQQVATERDALARERSAIAAAREHPQLQQRADSAMRMTVPRLFVGRDDVMASAELATYLGDVARASRVWLQDAATRPATVLPSGVRSLRVEVRGESDLRGILSMLRALEAGSKLVRVDRLDIARVNRGVDDDSETLSLSATVTAFALRADSSATAALPTATEHKAP